MRQSARMTGSKNSAHRASQAKAAFGRSFCLAVPDLTRNADIQLNERVSLRSPFEILSSIQSRGLASAAPTGHDVYCAIRGRCCVKAAAPPNRVWTESSMTRRRSLILSIENWRAQYLGIEVDDALQIAEQIEFQSSNLVMPALPYLPLGEGNVQRVEYGFEHVPNNRF